MIWARMWLNTSMVCFSTQRHQVWKVCEAGGVITPGTSTRPSLLVKCMCYTEWEVLPLFPLEQEFHPKPETLSFCTQLKQRAVSSLSNSRGPLNEELYSFIHWRPFWWNDCNRFVGLDWWIPWWEIGSGTRQVWEDILFFSNWLT